MRLTLGLLVAFVLGIAVGALVTHAPQPAPAVGDVAPANTERVPSARSLKRLAENAPAVEPTSTLEARGERTSEGLISEALRRYALDELRAGWTELRADEMPESTVAQGFERFDEEMRALPRSIGRRLAEKRTNEEKLASADPFAMLDALASGAFPPQAELVTDARRFSAFFDCASGPRIDGPSIEGEEELRETGLSAGTTVAYPAGAYTAAAAARLVTKGTRCVTFAGAGMDRTLLHVEFVATRERLDRLVLRDCTAYSDCGTIDLRAAGVFRAERVRFLGFDCGAGGCGLFDVVGGVLLQLEDCRIEGGFGRSPGDACLFDARQGAILARFDRCSFDLIRLDADRWGSGSAVVFDSCRLTNLLDPPARSLPETQLILRSTTVEYRGADAGRPLRRPLSEAFPGGIVPGGG